MPSKDEINVYVKLRDQFTAAFAKMQTKMQTGFSKVKSAVFSLQGAMVGVTAFVGTKMMGDWVKASNVQEEALARVGALARAQGKDWEIYRGRVEAATAALQDKTTYGDEEMMVAMKAALAAGVDLDRLMQEMPLVLDMAAATGMDLNAAFMYMGRAIEGDVTMLARYIPAIKKLSEEERTYENVKRLLNEQMMGTAEAIAATDAGKMKQIGNLWGDMKEELGGMVKELIMAPENMEAFSDTLKGLIEIASKGAGVIGNLRKGFGEMTDWLWEHTGAVQRGLIEQMKTNKALEHWKARLEDLLPRLEKMRGQGEQNTQAYKLLLGEAVALDKNIRKFSEETAIIWRERMIEAKEATDEVKKAQSDLKYMVSVVSEEIARIPAPEIPLEGLEEGTEGFVQLRKELRSTLTFYDRMAEASGKVAKTGDLTREKINIYKESLRQMGYTIIEEVIPASAEMTEKMIADLEKLGIKVKETTDEATQNFINWQKVAENVIDQFASTFTNYMFDTRQTTAAIEAKMEAEWAETMKNMEGASGAEIAKARAAWQRETDAMVAQGKKTWGEMLKDFGVMIAKMITQMLIAAALKAILLEEGGMFGFLPFEKGGVVGGPVYAQQGIIVNKPTAIIAGEKGPEVIFPLERLKTIIIEAIEARGESGGGQNVYYISALDSQSFEDFLRRGGAHSMQRVSDEGYKLITQKGIKR